VGCCHSISQCLSRNGGEGAQAATKSQRHASRWSRRGPARIGATQDLQGSRRRATLHCRTSWRRIRQASTILTATGGTSFVTKCGLACLLSCLTDASAHVVQTDELHTLVNTAVQVTSVCRKRPRQTCRRSLAYPPRTNPTRRKTSLSHPIYTRALGLPPSAARGPVRAACTTCFGR
jgi:hypothetical protein